MIVDTTELRRRADDFDEGGLVAVVYDDYIALLDDVDGYRHQKRELLRERDEARNQLSAANAEIERLRGEADKRRRHPMAPENCPSCNWTNINLMNYGTHGSAARWLCHGCAAQAIVEADGLRLDLVRWQAIDRTVTAERDDACAQLAAMTTARNEACDIADEQGEHCCVGASGCSGRQDRGQRIAELRKVGTP
jgi:hypothetical protein